MVRQRDKQRWSLEFIHALAADKLFPDAVNKYYSVPVWRKRGGRMLMNETVC